MRTPHVCLDEREKKPKSDPTRMRDETRKTWKELKFEPKYVNLTKRKRNARSENASVCVFFLYCSTFFAFADQSTLTHPQRTRTKEKGVKGKEKDVKIAISTSFPRTNCGIPQLCLVLFDFKDISETVHFRQIMFIISSTKKCRFLCEFPSSLLLCMEVGVGWTVEGEFPLFLGFLLAAGGGGGGGGGGTFHLSKSPSLPLSPYSEVSFPPTNPAGESPITMHNGVPKYYY